MYFRKGSLLGVGNSFENYIIVSLAYKRELQFSPGKGIEKANALTSRRAWQEDTVIRWTTISSHCNGHLSRVSSPSSRLLTYESSFFSSTYNKKERRKTCIYCHKYMFLCDITLWCWLAFISYAVVWSANPSYCALRSIGYRSSLLSTTEAHTHSHISAVWINEMKWHSGGRPVSCRRCRFHSIRGMDS